jgi:TolB-like protein
MKPALLLLTVASTFALAACGDIPVVQHRSAAGGAGIAPAFPTSAVPSTHDLGQLVYNAAELLAQRSVPLSKDRPIVVATLVDINDLNRSSTLGRLASQLVADKYSQHGYLIKDLTYTRGLEMKPGTGTLVLSEDVRNVAARNNAQAVIAGTYAVGGREIYLNLRLLRADDGAILSSADLVVPLDHNTEPMVMALADGR